MSDDWESETRIEYCCEAACRFRSLVLKIEGPSTHQPTIVIHPGGTSITVTPPIHWEVLGNGDCIWHWKGQALLLASKPIFKRATKSGGWYFIELMPRSSGKVWWDL